ncbi:E3 UFM1-protein ligase 1-like [Varroa destructor]|uniref:E3 UFM1-protein ligase 1 homolog n=1 Tax=Varroa destructor TaxID=109461 RepID=A0A7M7J817_VARDE|nr:E3 UFM1-protein ligase 1-like [Varroa destructor]
MATSWEEVKRLAADFQRAQLTSSVQRLSDRNCIEIVKKLISMKLIDVVFTTSGKEYITPQHLHKEIKDELVVAGGRIDLSILATKLQVDLGHIENAVTELLKTERDVKLVLDQLIADSYMDQLAEEVNERLQQKGELTMADIIKCYDVPAEFLRAGLMARMGRIIKGQSEDKEVLYTEAFVTMHRYRIRGALCAVTKPIQISTLIKSYALPERIAVNIVEQLIGQKKLLGLLSGHDDRAFYVPDIYSRAQKEWVTTNFNQNGFLEYDALSRLGLGDPKTFAKNLLQDKKVLFLSSVCIDEHLLSQVESSMEEANLTGSWVDVVSMLPSQLIAYDVNEIISHVISTNKLMRSCMHIIAETVVVSNVLVESCVRSFEPLLMEKAAVDLQSGIGKLFEELERIPDEISTERKKKLAADDEETDKKEERRKKATGGKSGGGTQGRETKTKSTKRKYGKKKAGGFDDSDDDGPSTNKGGRPLGAAASQGKKAEIVFMTLKEITDNLCSLELLQGSPDELSAGIAELIERQLNLKYKQVLKSLYMSSMNASASNRRKTHNELQERISTAIAQITLYGAGLDIFNGDLKIQLTKYLLRSLCTDLVNVITVYLTAELGLPIETENPNPEQRLRMINKMGGAQKETLLKVHQNLSGNSVDQFLGNMESVYGAGVLDMMIRVDRKRDRQVMSGHKLTLTEQLTNASEPALALHLAVLVVMQTQMQKMVHFSGKFVPQMVNFLKGKVSPDLHAELCAVEELVMKDMKLEEGAEKQELKGKLRDKLNELKELVVNYKRLSESK